MKLEKAILKVIIFTSLVYFVIMNASLIIIHPPMTYNNNSKLVLAFGTCFVLIKKKRCHYLHNYNSRYKSCVITIVQYRKTVHYITIFIHRVLNSQKERSQPLPWVLLRYPGAPPHSTHPKNTTHRIAWQHHKSNNVTYALFVGDKSHQSLVPVLLFDQLSNIQILTSTHMASK